MSDKKPIKINYLSYTVEFTYQKKEDYWFGHILYIQDLITAIAKNRRNMAFEAREAVDDYIKTCEEEGIEPNKPCGRAE